MFNCDKCGLCCKNIGGSPIYSWLDRGDGICRHFDDASKLCRIYANRPILCNIDQSYERFFQNKMSREAFYALNMAACEALKQEKEMGDYG